MFSFGSSLHPSVTPLCLSFIPLFIHYFCNYILIMNVKKVLYEKVVVPTVMYGSESWGMKVTERQKLNVFETKCLRSMTGVSRLNRVRNEE